jgi:hypothetical protein
MGQNRLLGRQKLFKILILSLSFVSILLNLGDGPGEDIERARLDYLSGQGSDFLGGYASVFYASLPNLFFEWWQYLTILQGALAGLGLYLLLKNTVNQLKSRHFYLILLFCYFVINLSLAQTRDGIMISASLMFLSHLKSGKKQSFLITILVFCFIFSFRPWLAFAFLPIFYVHLCNFKSIKPIFSILLSLVIVSIPSLIESGIVRTLEIKPGYPQQTVMIHDLVSTFCLSPISETRKLAYAGISQLAVDESSLDKLCYYYKPNTWQSSITAYPTDQFFPMNLPLLKTVDPGDNELYKKIESSWIKLIINDPKSYMQNHLIFFGQVILGGESYQFRSNTISSDLNKYRALKQFYTVVGDLYDSPWTFIAQIHFLSPLITIFFVLVLYSRRSNTIYRRSMTPFVLSFFIWVALTTLGYVSDNGRYTYLPTLIIYSNFLYQFIHDRKLTN